MSFQVRTISWQKIQSCYQYTLTCFIMFKWFDKCEWRLPVLFPSVRLKELLSSVATATDVQPWNKPSYTLWTQCTSFHTVATWLPFFTFATRCCQKIVLENRMVDLPVLFEILLEWFWVLKSGNCDVEVSIKKKNITKLEYVMYKSGVPWLNVWYSWAT